MPPPRRPQGSSRPRRLPPGGRDGAAEGRGTGQPSGERDHPVAAGHGAPPRTGRGALPPGAGSGPSRPGRSAAFAGREAARSDEDRPPRVPASAAGRRPVLRTAAAAKGAAAAPHPRSARPTEARSPDRDEAPSRRGTAARHAEAGRPSPPVRSFSGHEERAPGRTGRPASRHEPREEPSPSRPAARPAPPIERPDPGTLWLHGLHAVAAALANPQRRLKRLLLTAEAESALAGRFPPPWKLGAERVQDRTRFHTFLPEDAVHQGAALLVHALPSARLEDALAASAGPVLLLDQVTDPRNVGAILRSAAAFGAAAVVMQDRHAPPETGALARAASGALEVVPVVREVNLSRVIHLLQKRGAWVMGLAGEAPRSLAAATAGLDGRRAALVLGAEDAGLRRLQRETCDELVRLPIAPGVESLNVAAAAAVALYELARREG